MKCGGLPVTITTSTLDLPAATAVATGILDLPAEIFHNLIFKYLGAFDIHSLGKSGSHRLKEISENYLELRKSSQIINPHVILL